MPIRYELTRFGQGFDDRRPMTRHDVLAKLRERLKRLQDPFTIHGDATATRYNVEGVMVFMRNHIDALKEHERIIISGSAYDQPKWVVRGVEVVPAIMPMVGWAVQFIGRSPYLLGGPGPPGQSDCSGLTMNAAQAAYGIELPHGAELQKQSDKINIFHDASDLRQDDFMYFNYGRLNWPEADHVELVDKPGVRNLGSRPSTNGVDFYVLEDFDKDNILGFGRLKGT